MERIIFKALEKDPGLRYQSASELQADLRRLKRDLDSGRTSSQATTTPRGVKSLAVLPFENAGGDPDLEYLSDGLTESLISALSQLPGMQVMARTAPRSVSKDLPIRLTRRGA